MGCFEEADVLLYKYEEMLKKGEITPVFDVEVAEESAKAESQTSTPKPTQSVAADATEQTL